MSCSCNQGNNTLATVEEDALAVDAIDEALSAAEAAVPRTCADFAEFNRKRLLANPSRNPGLRPRRRVTFRKLDPCNETLDPQTLALQAQLAGLTDENCPTRVCRTPSVFRATTDREALEECYENGFRDALNDATVGSGGRSRCGGQFAGAGNEKRYGQLCTRSRNLLQRAPRFCRTPSIFTCNDDRCQAALCVEIGASDVFPDQQHRSFSGRCNAGLGAARGPDQKVFNDLCIRVTRFGNQL